MITNAGLRKACTGRTLKVNNERLLFLILFFYMTFENAIINYASGIVHQVLSYTDELLTCALLLWLFLKCAGGRTRILNLEAVIIRSMFIFVFLGVISDIVHPMQSAFLWLSEIIVCSRFLVFYFAARILYKDANKSKRLLQSIYKISKVSILILFILTLHDLFLPPFFTTCIRYSMRSVQLIFSHPTFMAVACMTLATGVIAGMGLEIGTTRKDFIFILMAAVCMFFTLRSKAIASASCMILLYFLLLKFRIKGKYFLLLGIGSIALVLGWSQLNFYYFHGAQANFARAVLVRDSIKLANQYFPIGTGFGTFASGIAAEYYSPLYYQLGYNGLQAMSPEDTGFLVDTFWPAVIAQTGWLGTIAFLIILVCFFMLAFRMMKINVYFYWMMLSILIYELISSTSEFAFFSPMVAPLFFLIGLVVNTVCVKSVEGA